MINGHKVLVVDDSWTDLTLIATPLRQSGYDVITATDGEEAIEKALSERPNCIVLDVVLPKQNGYQVCRHLKQMEGARNIPVIMVSVKDSPLDRRWALQQGAAMYLAKPFQAGELIESIRSLV
jgi:twitching motility two-component system response regulator PilH